MFSLFSYLRLTFFQLKKCLLLVSILLTLLCNFVTFLFSPSTFPPHLLSPLFNFSSIWDQTPLIYNNWFCFFHITTSLQWLPHILWPPASWLSSEGLRTWYGSALCCTSSSPTGSTTALPGLPPLPNVVMETDSQWALETPCWAKTGRKRHWAASVGGW